MYVNENCKKKKASGFNVDLSVMPNIRTFFIILTMRRSRTVATNTRKPTCISRVRMLLQLDELGIFSFIGFKFFYGVLCNQICGKVQHITALEKTIRAHSTKAVNDWKCCLPCLYTLVAQDMAITTDITMNTKKATTMTPPVTDLQNII